MVYQHRCFKYKNTVVFFVCIVGTLFFEKVLRYVQEFLSILIQSIQYMNWTRFLGRSVCLFSLKNKQHCFPFLPVTQNYHEAPIPENS